MPYRKSLLFVSFIIFGLEAKNHGRNRFPSSRTYKSSRSANMRAIFAKGFIELHSLSLPGLFATAYHNHSTSSSVYIQHTQDIHWQAVAFAAEKRWIREGRAARKALLRHWLLRLCFWNERLDRASDFSPSGHLGQTVVLYIPQVCSAKRAS
ncbi:hypothetical protein B0T16DRAFT_79135 [Cercophora newfieldiana]|uniref:Secreted protein n=1 Tax=Cercophora newfieldiana TaxID=92897 RepID=A0AA39YH75_9PEZI|nr:hypothetical protein B0T16DRAFT_79135 [Cercophora newfieldiana]